MIDYLTTSELFAQVQTHVTWQKVFCFKHTLCMHTTSLSSWKAHYSTASKSCLLFKKLFTNIWPRPISGGYYIITLLSVNRRIPYWWSSSYSTSILLVYAPAFLTGRVHLHQRTGSLIRAIPYWYSYLKTGSFLTSQAVTLHQGSGCIIFL